MTRAMLGWGVRKAKGLVGQDQEERKILFCLSWRPVSLAHSSTHRNHLRHSDPDERPGELLLDAVGSLPGWSAEVRTRFGE